MQGSVYLFLKDVLTYYMLTKSPNVPKEDITYTKQECKDCKIELAMLS